MRLRVIAVGYDGTIAKNGVLDQTVRKGIRLARNRGLFVVIVSGGILSELCHVAGNLALLMVLLLRIALLSPYQMVPQFCSVTRPLFRF